MRAMGTVWCSLFLLGVATACVQPLPQQIGGTVTGLTGTLNLLNNNGDPIVITQNGAFKFTIPVSNYNVTVQAQPIGQQCTIANGSGTVNGAPITNVAVTCGPSPIGPYTVSGNATGISTGSITITLNGGDPITLSGNGPFAFTTLVPLGQTYSVAVENSNDVQCAVANATGTMQTNVTDILVACTQLTYTISGTVTNLQGSVTLTNQTNSDTFTVTSPNNTFSFPTKLNPGTGYNVVVSQNPTNQTCTVNQSTGVAGNSNNVPLVVACRQALRSITVVVTGLTGQGAVQVVNNGSDILTIGQNGSYTFEDRIPDSSVFNVTVKSQPPGQACVIPNPVGTVFGTDITNIDVVCSSPKYLFNIGGIASGMQGPVTLTNEGVDTLVVTQNGTFNFPIPFYNFATYDVRIASVPSATACTIQTLNGVEITFTGAGSVSGSDINTLRLACGPGYTVGGSVGGLSGGTVYLLNNNSDLIAVTSNTTFVFDAALATNASYNVTVLSTPANQTCAVTGGTGTIATSNINNVNVSCTNSSTSTFSIGGTVSGLSGNLTLSNDGVDSVAVSANGTFHFPLPLSNMAPYVVSVAQQPIGQVCTVFDETGLVSDQNVTSVAVVCAPGNTIQLPISGLTGGNVIIESNVAPTTIFTGNGTFAFPPAVLNTTTVVLNVASSPAHQQCVVVNPSGDFNTNTLQPYVVCAPYYSFVSGQNANSVIGQGDFYSSTCNTETLTADSNTVCFPYGDAFVDGSNNLYVTDFGNNRALMYQGIPGSNGAAASVVIGQSNFASTGSGLSATTLNHPGGATGDSSHVAVVDRFNSRVLIYNTPVGTNPAASVVLGQPNKTSNTGACTVNGLRNPQGAIIAHGKVFVADTGNHRVLIWNSVPTTDGAGATYVLGQSSFTSCNPTAPTAIGASNLNGPGDVWSDGTNIIVADTLNNRVLIWSNFLNAPGNGMPADGVLGQPNMSAYSNKNTSQGMQLPSSVTSNGSQLFVADAGNSRVLIWNTLPLLYTSLRGSTLDIAADLELGQVAFGLSSCNGQTNAANLPNQAGPATLCNPSGVTISNNSLVVTDTTNNRYMVYAGF